MKRGQEKRLSELNVDLLADTIASLEKQYDDLNQERGTLLDENLRRNEEYRETINFIDQEIGEVNAKLEHFRSRQRSVRSSGNPTQ